MKLLVLAACLSLGGTAGITLARIDGRGPRGISQADAIGAARREAGGQVTSVTSARAGRLSAFDALGPQTDGRGDVMVWAVAFRGAFSPPSCGPPGNTHCPNHETELVILDYYDGSFIEGLRPVPTFVGRDIQ